MDGLEREWGESVQVVQINIQDDANRALVARFNASFTPTFILLDTDGREAWRSVGSIDSAEVRDQVETLLQS